MNQSHETASESKSHLFNWFYYEDRDEDEYFNCILNVPIGNLPVGERIDIIELCLERGIAKFTKFITDESGKYGEENFEFAVSIHFSTF